MARKSSDSWRTAIVQLVAVIWEQGDVSDMEPKIRREVDFEREVALLDEFIMSHNSVYDFCAMLEPNRAAGGDVLQTSRRPGTQDNPFIQLLQALLELRFLEGRWTQLESETHKLVILQTLRILTRDTMLQRRFLNRGGGEELVHIFDEQGARHLSEPLQQGPGAQNPLVHVASMLAKLDPNSPLLVQCRRTLCCLLSTSERFLLQSVLASLHKLSASPMILSPHCQGLMQMPTGDGMTAGEKLLDILSSDKMKPEYRQLAAEVVLNLCQTEDSRMLIVSLEGIKLLLGMVQNCSENLLVVTIRILERLVHYDSRQALHQDAVRQTRTLGGINVVLNMLNRFNDATLDAIDTCRLQVLMAGCGLLGELAFDDDNSAHIGQLNGVFVLTKVIVFGWNVSGTANRSNSTEEGEEKEECIQVNMQALRALRLVFSLERNRRSFKRVFPPSIFERFIEIGQYQRELSKYRALATLLAALPSDKQTSMRKAVSDMRADLDSDRRVRDYLLRGEPIGKGSFGTIWRARMAGGGGVVGSPTHYALKEIPLEGPESEDDVKTQSEVKLLSQIQHPNIVKYVDSFTDKAVNTNQTSLYIVMELVDGSSIAQLISSHMEKMERISERDIREMMLSISHALYYIHKKKMITHRDLTPSNVLLTSDKDALTGVTRQKPVLVDFGLARQRQTDLSVMASVVGTLTYSCPELIQRKPYTDKADIWSLGVILYQLVALKNPFTDTNPLQTARKIVEGEIEPIIDPDDFYSADLKTLIMKMMTPTSDERPDIIQVMSEMGCWDRSDRMTRRDAMERTDELYMHTQHLQQHIRELEVEKQRLDSVVRSRRESSTRGGPIGAYVAAAMHQGPAATPTAGLRSPFRARATGMPMTPHTPGISMAVTPHTPASAYGRHFPQTPAAKTTRVGIGSSLRVPAAHVKEIDPASHMLNQLHKILFVTQLPPDMGDGQSNAQALHMRRAIEKYKRCLFGRYLRGKEGLSLKEELKKFLNNRQDVIPVDFRPLVDEQTDNASPDRWTGKLTYHEMGNWIEALLKENHYYDSEPQEVLE